MTSQIKNFQDMIIGEVPFDDFVLSIKYVDKPINQWPRHRFHVDLDSGFRVRVKRKLYPIILDPVCVNCRAKCIKVLIVSSFRKDKNPRVALIADNGYILTEDHIIPRSKGGSSNADNIQVLCEKCNNKKSVIDEWR